MIRRIIAFPGRAWKFALDSTKEIIMKILLTILLFTGYLIFAMIVYVAMRHVLVPQKTHVVPVHLYFSSQCASNTHISQTLHNKWPPSNNHETLFSQKCHYPFAEFFLAGGERLLSPGHSYTIAVELEMPESPQNELLGMFMVNLTLYSNSGKNLGTSIRPAMLHYKSSLLHTMSTMLFSFPLILGLTEEKQRITISMIEDYQESFFTEGSIYARVTIMTYDIQLYNVYLTFDANFSGITYYLYHWPISMATIVVSGIFFSITMVTILVWIRRGIERMNRFTYYRRFTGQRMQLRAPGLEPIPEEEEEDDQVRERRVRVHDDHVEEVLTEGSPTPTDTSSVTEITTSDLSELDISQDKEVTFPEFSTPVGTEERSLQDANTVRHRTT